MRGSLPSALVAASLLCSASCMIHGNHFYHARRGPDGVTRIVWQAEELNAEKHVLALSYNAHENGMVIMNISKPFMRRWGHESLVGHGGRSVYPLLSLADMMQWVWILEWQMPSAPNQIEVYHAALVKDAATYSTVESLVGTGPLAPRVSPGPEWDTFRIYPLKYRADDSRGRRRSALRWHACQRGLFWVATDTLATAYGLDFWMIILNRFTRIAAPEQPPAPAWVRDGLEPPWEAPAEPEPEPAAPPGMSRGRLVASRGSFSGRVVAPPVTYSVVYVFDI